MPTIGTNSKPAYVYDAGTDTWIPIGPGEHTHDYIGKNVITTTGDIIYASAANTPARLGIGSTDQVLKVSGGVPVWGSAGSTLVGAQATLSSEQTISTGTWTAVGFNTETYGFDTNSFHDNSTNNSRFTIPSGKGGYYLIMGQGEMASTTSYNQRSKIVLNGSTDISCGLANTWSTNGDHTFYSQTVYNLAAGDYVEFHVFQNSGASRQLQSNLSFPGITKMTLIKVGD